MIISDEQGSGASLRDRATPESSQQAVSPVPGGIPSASTVQKNCLACGDLITVRLADHKRGWGKFCDKACSAAHKCGQRPRDVNAFHAKKSLWAADRMRWFATNYGGEKPPMAPRLKDQIGKVKVVPIYHSPSECRECGKPVNGPGLCFNCDAEHDAMTAMEAGWDGHKVWTE